MEYGMYYLGAKKPDDDTVSMFSANALPSTYEAVHPQYVRELLEDESLAPPSPVHPSPLQQSQSSFSSRRSTRSGRSFFQPSPVSIAQVPLPPQQHADQITEAALESRAVLNRPYQESIAYQNVTPFQPAREHGPKPDYEALAYNAEDRRPPSYGPQIYHRGPRRVKDPWRPGRLMRLPIWGIGALLGVLAFTGTSVGILLASDGDQVIKWEVNYHNIQPSVYLSAFALIMDSLTACALADALVVRFWTQALRGVFLSALHDIFESGHLFGALSRALRLEFNMVAIACLLAAVSTVRGPLFQRASTIISDAVDSTSGVMNFQMASAPIIDYFEASTTNPQVRGLFTPDLSTLVRDLNAGIPYAYNASWDDDARYATVKGIGFKVNCTTDEQSFDLNSLPDANECKTCSDKICESRCRKLASQLYNHNFFSVGYSTNSVDGISSQGQALTLFSTFKSEPNCVGTIQTHYCSLYQGTVNYHITLSNGTISRMNPYENFTIPSNDTETAFNNSVSLDTTFMSKYWPTIFQTLFPPISVNVSIREDFGTQVYTKCITPSSDLSTWAAPQANASDCSGTSPPPLQDLSIRYATPRLDAGGRALGDICNTTWRNPMPDLVASMHELAFRISLATAMAPDSVFLPGLSAADVAAHRQAWTQTVDYRGWQTRAVFRTDVPYLGLGVVASLLGVVATLPLYTGWWGLGRKPSLSPLEVGRAFGAPVLEGVDGNAGAARIVAEKGGTAVRYGVVERFGEEKKLRIEVVGKTRAPWTGEVFG